MKRKINAAKSLQMLDHGPTVLLGVMDKENSRLNLFAVSWIIPCSHKPPLVVFSCNPKNYSKTLIEKAGEFTVNIPPVSLIDQLHFCGTTSGRDVDKVKQLSLTTVKSQVLHTHLIDECLAHMECKVVQRIVAGDHTLFLAEVLDASANEDFYKGSWFFNRPQGKTLHYLGGKRYAAIGEVLEAKLYK